MLGQILVTKQTGAEGKIVSKVGITLYFLLCLYFNSQAIYVLNFTFYLEKHSKIFLYSLNLSLIFLLPTGYFIAKFVNLCIYEWIEKLYC